MILPNDFIWYFDLLFVSDILSDISIGKTSDNSLKEPNDWYEWSVDD